MTAAVPTITLSFKDVVERRAFVVLPPAAKLKLCKLAGAPWNDGKPDAELSPLMHELFHRREREKILHGGSGLGKSVMCAMELACDVMLPYHDVALGASRYEHVAAEFKYIARFFRTLFKRHKHALRRLVCKNQSNYHEYDVQTMWGSRCVGISTDSDEGAAFLGKSYHRVGLGEGSHISPVILDTRIMRALDRAMGAYPLETGYLSIYTTPRGYEGCSAAEWERVMKQTRNAPEKYHYGSVPFAKTVWLREAAVTENPSYSTEAFEARRDTLEKKAFEEQYMGRMTWRTGMVFPELDPVAHSRPMPRASLVKRMRLGVGIDTGAYTGIVLSGLVEPVPGMRERWKLGEVYTEQQTITDSLDLMRHLICRILGGVYGLSPDPEKSFDTLKERIDVWVIDPASQHKMEVMEALGVATMSPKLEILDSVDRMRLWIQRGELLLVDGETDLLMEQLKKYTWKTYRGTTKNTALRTPVVKEPRKEFDHLIDASRLVDHVLEELGPLEEEPEPITVAESWEAHRRGQVVGPLRAAMARAEARGGIAC